MAGWLRLYTEIRHDRKLRRLTPAQRWLWITVLTIAKESPVPGTLLLSENVPVTNEDLADEAAISIEEVESGIEAFVNQNMLEEVDDVYKLINWDKRQFVNDSSTERVRKYRAKKKEQSKQEQVETEQVEHINQDETLQKRYSNKNETAPEYRVQSTDTDNKYIYTVFDHWNEKKIIVHKELTKKLKGHINAKLKTHSIDDILMAINNYNTCLKSDDYFLSYKWTLGEFLTRENGFIKFLPENKPLENFLKGGQARGDPKQRDILAYKENSPYKHVKRGYRPELLKMQ